MSKQLFPVVILTSLSLLGCSTVVSHLPGVYTLEIQQGNIIDQAMINQLKPGMNKRQVLYIMGSPMLTDFFHQKRWDYLYYDKKAGEDKIQKRVVLYFNNDQIVGIQGDLKPGDLAEVKTAEQTTLDLPKRDLDKTLWDKITGWFS